VGSDAFDAATCEEVLENLPIAASLCPVPASTANFCDKWYGRRALSARLGLHMIVVRSNIAR
jgi:hypothetical protein